MGLTKTFNFLDPTLYTFDGDLINFTASQKPRLKLQDNPGQNFTEDFADDTDFIYDSDLAEFVSGVVRQKNVRPANAILYASFNNNEDANWTDIGTGVGTLSNGATIHDNQLDLTGYVVNRSLSIEAYNTSHNSQKGCIRFKYIPNYTGNPTQLQYMAQWRNGGIENNIQIYHQPGGFIRVWIYDGVGGKIVDSPNIGTWSPIAGQTYEIELDWDCDAGEHRIFINGVQQGSTMTGTGTRDGRVDQFDFGVYYNNTGQPNFYIDEFIYYNAVQHTTDYTPDWSNIYEYDYMNSVVICPEMEYIGAGALVTFDSFIVTETNSPKYTLQIGRSGNYLYWDGAAWSVSDGTYAQANDATTFNANLSDLNIEGAIYGQFKVHFTDSNTTQSNVDELTASLTAQIYSILNPTITIIEEFGIEALENFFQNATISGNDQIKYILTKDGTDYYYNGSNWATSDGTYSQSNTVAEIEANKSTFTTIGIDLGVTIFLHSDDGTTTPELDSITIIYNFFGGLPTEPTKCIVYGYCYEGDGNDLSDVIITASLNDFHVIYNNEINLFREEIITTPDSEGYWELNLINTALMESGSRYIFKFAYDGGSVIYIKQVPNETRKNFAELED